MSTLKVTKDVKEGDMPVSKKIRVNNDQQVRGTYLFEIEDFNSSRIISNNEIIPILLGVRKRCKDLRIYICGKSKDVAGELKLRGTICTFSQYQH
jgi:hypothetical protein